MSAIAANKEYSPYQQAMYGAAKKIEKTSPDKNVSSLNRELYELEGIPFATDITRESAYQGKKLCDWVDTARTLHETVKDKTSKNPLFRQECELLQKQMIALLYRSGQAENVSSKRTAEIQNEFLEVLSYYRKDTHIFKDGISSLTKHEESIIQQTCLRYPLFVEELLKQKNNQLSHLNQKGAKLDNWTSEFVTWALRSHCDIGIFVELPNERLLLHKSHLDKRSGTIDKNFGMYIGEFDDPTNTARKVRALGLRMGLSDSFRKNDKNWNECLLNPNVDCSRKGFEFKGTIYRRLFYYNVHGKEGKKRVVHLENLVNRDAPPYVIKVQDIYNQFKEKTHGYGNVEYLEQGGISNWNTVEIGSFNPALNGGKGGYDHVRIADNDGIIDPNFITRLPVLHTLSREELQEQYPGQTLPRYGYDEFGYVLNMSRVMKNMHIQKNHGYWTYILPTNNDRSYRVYPMCIQAGVIPNTDCGNMKIMCSTVPAKTVIYDESYYTNNRQRYGELHIVNEEELDNTLIQVGKWIQDGRANNMIFQPQGHNCAHYSQELFKIAVSDQLLDQLESLAFNHASDKQMQKLRSELEKAFTYFDDKALDRTLNLAIDSLVDDEQTAQLCSVLSTTLTVLMRTLYKDDTNQQAELENLINEIESIQKFSDQSLTPKTRAELKKAIKSLIRDCVKGTQFYRTDLFHAKFPTFLRFLMPLIKAIPWTWLKNFILSAVMFIFFNANKSVKVKKVIIDKHGRKKTVTVKERFTTNGYFANHTFNLPAGMMNNLKYRATLRKDLPSKIDKVANLMREHMSVQTQNEVNEEAIA